MMPFLFAEFANIDQLLPLYVCCIGNHAQKHLNRQEGYHAHQIFFCRSGKGVFRILDQQDVIVTPGMLFILPANTAHEYYSLDTRSAWDLGFVSFEGSAASMLMEQMNMLVLKAVPAPNFSELWNQLESLWHLLSLNGEQAFWEASKRIYSLVVSILEAQAPIRKVNKQISPPDQINTALQTAVKLIHDHYNERLLMSNIARAAGYSVQHFHRLFVEYFHMTPQKYILQLRMRKALHLFEEYPDITVEKVAETVGMETSYFIRIFKRMYGTTPKQYVLRW